VRAGFSILAVLLEAAKGVQETIGHEDDAPWRRISEHSAHLALVLSRGLSHQRTELHAEGSQAGVADLKTYVGHRHFARNQQMPGPVHSQASQEFMWRLAEGGGKQAMEVKWREAGFPRRSFQIYSRLIVRSQKVTRPAETPEGVIVNESPSHGGQ